MLRRSDGGPWVAVGLVLVGVAGCAKTRVETVADVGHHRIRFVLPKGWEHLDHGRQQLFRFGEAQVSLVDMGPATREAMTVELRAADSLWQAGRRKDAFQRIRALRSPSLQYASHEQRADFWKPWTDAVYVADRTDSGSLGVALQALIAGVEALPDVTPERTLEYVLYLSTDTRRSEIGHRESRSIDGAEWVDLELWDRVSHMNRSRIAYLVNEGYLLVLATDHGLYEVTGPGLEALLTSMKVSAAASGMR
jgi:hypothetical protein